MMYVIKVKGKKKIPNYIQLRDENFTLIGYFSYREDRPFLNLDKFGLEGKEDLFKDFIERLPFGKLTKLEF
jgi:hypothetical protein